MQVEEKESRPPIPGEEEATFHAYPVTIGGIQGVLHTKEEIPPDYFTDTTVVESEEPNAPTTQPASQQKEPPYFLHFLLILMLFMLLDNVNNSIFTFLSPTATITIIPKTARMQTTATFPLAQLQGRVLPSLTLTQSETLRATGRGHQDARSASGIVTFYNGLSTPQNIAAGTVLTGNDGISVATDQAATIPPANPPSLGEVSVTAHAENPGSSGNIQAGDINATLATGLFVKNTSAFSGGRNARNFSYVTQADIQQAMNTLTPKLLQSEQAAISAQVKPQEQLIPPMCQPTTTSDHQPGDEAPSVEVTVSETCSAVVYNKDALQTQATALLSHQALQTLGTGYRLFGNIQANVSHTAHPQTTLVFFVQGTWIYQINEQRIKSMVAGKPRLDAIRLLSALSGITSVSIAGIADNNLLPDDPQHITFLVVVGS